jgi:hypothetical protein
MFGGGGGGGGGGAVDERGIPKLDAAEGETATVGEVARKPSAAM